MTEAETTATLGPSLAAVVDRLQSIHAKYNLSAIQRHIDACKAAMEQGDLLSLGIFGRFKAGKSSFLNFISGKRVLPVGVTPVTAVITRLHYGDRDRATVRYRHGSAGAVPLESVKTFMSEAENPGNAKGVASVTVELESLKAYRGLQFVDTPGLESVLRHNTEAALDWLPKVGLAVVAVGVDPPLSKHDIELIRALKTYTPKIVVLLTKADLVSEKERMEVAAFITTELRKEFGCDFRVYPFSVHPAHEALRAAVQRELLNPLLENRDSARADIVRFKFKALIDRTKDYLSLALAAAERAEADRSHLKRQVLGERTSIDAIRMELQALARDSAGRTRPWIMERMEALFPEVSGRVTLEITEKLSGLKGNLWKLSRAYEQWLEESLRREMTAISSREGDLFCVPLERARATLARAVQGFRDRLAGNIERVLGVHFSAGQFDIEVAKPRVPSISKDSLFMFQTDLLWFVIPMRIFRPLVVKHFLGRISWEVTKNQSRLASQWTEAINAAILKMQRDAERSVRDQISTVESLLSRTQSETEEIRTAIAEVEALGAVIHS